MAGLGTWLEGKLLTRPPQRLRGLLPDAEFVAPALDDAGRPLVYLTFDDGPIPEETPWILSQLAEYQALATFFCVGDNLLRYPDIARAALAAGHRLGNHTQHHRSAWATSGPEYLAGVGAAQRVLESLQAADEELVGPAQARVHQPRPGASQPLFRPPYGRLTGPVLRALRPHYRVVLWSVLTRDYDPALDPAECLRQTLAAVRPGDIVVFHDSRKAHDRLRHVLPRLLAHLAAQNFQFLPL